jgi:uncharacterized membrane protein YphA (DoxX/SURF4 family)
MTHRFRTTETVLAAILAVIFVLTGATKVIGLPMMADQFADWSYPTWFMYVVGLMEIAGAGLLVAVRTRRLGAFLIGIIMVGAIATHVRVGEMAMTPAPLVMLLAVLWLLRRRTETYSPDDDAVNVEPAREKDRAETIGTR